MIIVKNSKLVKKGYLGLTLYPFIFLAPKAEKLKPSQYKVLINHEKIHIEQQKEMLIFVFFLIYLLNYFINLIRYRNRHEAYINIIFEKEANAHELDNDYLSRRKLFNWVNYGK